MASLVHPGEVDQTFFFLMVMVDFINQSKDKAKSIHKNYSTRILNSFKLGKTGVSLLKNSYVPFSLYNINKEDKSKLVNNKIEGSSFSMTYYSIQFDVPVPYLSWYLQFFQNSDPSHLCHSTREK